MTGRLRGVTGIEDFARSFIGGLELDQMDHVPLDLDNVLRALDGRLLVAAPGPHRCTTGSWSAPWRSTRCSSGSRPTFCW